MKKIKVVVTGAAGRMGQTIIKKVLNDKGLKLVGALEISGHRNLGQDIGKILKTKKNQLLLIVLRMENNLILILTGRRLLVLHFHIFATAKNSKKMTFH